MKNKFILTMILIITFIVGLFLGASLFQREPKPEKCNSGIYYELIDGIMYQSYLPEMDTCSKL